VAPEEPSQPDAKTAALETPPPVPVAGDRPAKTLAEAVATTRDAVVNIGTPGTLGAGVIVTADGTIVTNFHVIADALQAPRRGLFPTAEGRVAPSRPTVSARFEDGRELSALVVVADAEQDLAILRLISDDPDEQFASVALGNSGEAAVGQEVFAIGNPFGLSHTVSRGIVSAIDRTSVLPNRVPLLQLDATINVGNSGGPLFDLEGRLLGIVTAKNRDSHGIAFAVPVDHLRGFLRAVADPVAGRRSGAIGIYLDAKAALPGEASALGYTAGLLISGVDHGGPAASAGIVEGDVLVSVHGKRLDGLSVAGDPEALGQHVVSSVRSLFAGETFDVALVRDGELVEVAIEVGAATPERQALIDAEELLGLKLDGADASGAVGPRVLAVVDGTPLTTLSAELVGASVVKVMNREIRSTDELGQELGRVRALLRSQPRAVQVLVGFADPEGNPLGAVHVVVG
ncbi:MAG: trypsin-like peptidase domain-containing protein, partial [Myxococcota bacterium]